MSLTLILGLHANCGKRADPFAPYVKTPRPPSALEVSQVGNEVEIKVLAPQTTTENRPLPLLQLEWLQAPPSGAFGKLAATILREDVAPGERRAKRFPIPSTETRFSVRAYSGKTPSAPAAPTAFKPAPVPLPPTALDVTDLPGGVELHWTNPPGAEPWPSPTPPASPSPAPGDSSKASAQVATRAPSSASPPEVEPAPTPAPSPVVSLRPSPSARPSPRPPTLPTGIRIFRTDGVLRLAREPLQASTWLDTTAKPGDKPCYSLRYAASLKPLVESAPVEPVCVTVKDLVAPEAPGNLVGDIGATFVELSWKASASPDVEFYRLYRTIGEGPRIMTSQTDGLVLRVQDPDLTSGPRNYEIVAVDKGGNESKPGPVLKIDLP